MMMSYCFKRRSRRRCFETAGVGNEEITDGVFKKKEDLVGYY